MAVVVDKLNQVTLNTNANIVTLATGKAGGQTQVVSIWFANININTARTVTLLGHGTSWSLNTLIPEIIIPPKGTYILQLNGTPITLTGNTQSLYAYQDIGTDVIATCYGLII